MHARTHARTHCRTRVVYHHSVALSPPRCLVTADHRVSSGLWTLPIFFSTELQSRSIFPVFFHPKARGLIHMAPAQRMRDRAHAHKHAHAHTHTHARTHAHAHPNPDPEPGPYS